MLVLDAYWPGGYTPFHQGCTPQIIPLLPAHCSRRLLIRVRWSVRQAGWPLIRPGCLRLALESVHAPRWTSLGCQSYRINSSLHNFLNHTIIHEIFYKNSNLLLHPPWLDVLTYTPTTGRKGDACDCHLLTHQLR